MHLPCLAAWLLYCVRQTVKCNLIYGSNDNLESLTRGPADIADAATADSAAAETAEEIWHHRAKLGT